MKRKTKNIGSYGEGLALDFLRNKGYLLLEKNWRWSRAEIDLIFQYDQTLVIVEVKTRSSSFFGHPASMLSSRQKRFLWEAANMYMAENGWEGEVRFDIVSVLLKKHAPPLIEHFVDAFVP